MNLKKINKLDLLIILVQDLYIYIRSKLLKTVFFLIDTLDSVIFIPRRHCGTHAPGSHLGPVLHVFEY